MSDWRQTNPNNRKNPSSIKITTQITLITKTMQITLVPLITLNHNRIPYYVTINTTLITRLQ